MATFLIAYDLHGVKDRSIYDSINQDILKSFEAVKVLNTTFLIKGNFSVTALCESLKKIINKYISPGDYELMVVEVNHYDGWLAKTTINKLSGIA